MEPSFCGGLVQPKDCAATNEGLRALTLQALGQGLPQGTVQRTIPASFKLGLIKKINGLLSMFRIGPKVG